MIGSGTDGGLVPFASSGPLTASLGRGFYLLPHDTRRRLVAVFRPRAFSKMQKARELETDDGYSFKPFDDLECIFVHIPKAAGVSIARGLFGNLGGGHASISMYELVFPKRQFDSYFKFAFVRNPWDRLLSAYMFLKSGGMDDSDKRWAAELRDFDTLDAFVTNWLTPQNAARCVHFVPQSKFVCRPFTGALAVDYIGRYETLQNDYQVVLARLGIHEPTGLPYENIGPAQKDRDFRRFYSDAARRIVGEVYRDDVEFFGYSFD